MATFNDAEWLKITCVQAGKLMVRSTNVTCRFRLPQDFNAYPFYILSIDRQVGESIYIQANSALISLELWGEDGGLFQVEGDLHQAWFLHEVSHGSIKFLTGIVEVNLLDTVQNNSQVKLYCTDNTSLRKFSSKTMEINASAFGGCESLEILDTPYVVAHNLYDIDFHRCLALPKIPSIRLTNQKPWPAVKYWDRVSGDFGPMEQCTALVQLPEIVVEQPLELFGTLYFNQLCKGCTSLQDASPFLDTLFSIIKQPYAWYGFSLYFEEAFANCTSLQTITTNAISFTSGDFLTCWMPNMFANCTSLTHAPSLIFGAPTSYMNIWLTSMWANCTSLTQAPSIEFRVLTIEKLRVWAEYMFQNTSISALPEITVKTPATKGSDILEVYPGATICEYAHTELCGIFDGCSQLHRITLPDWLVCSHYDRYRIPVKAFCNCTNLQSVKWPSGGSLQPSLECFKNCGNLTEIPSLDMSESAPNSLENCRSLKKITIAEGISTFAPRYLGFSGDKRESQGHPNWVKGIGLQGIITCLDTEYVSIDLLEWGSSYLPITWTIRYPDGTSKGGMQESWIFTSEEANIVLYNMQIYTVSGVGVATLTWQPDARYKSWKTQVRVKHYGSYLEEYLRSLTSVDVSITDIIGNYGYDTILVKDLTTQHTTNQNSGRPGPSTSPITNYPTTVLASMDLEEGEVLTYSINTTSINSRISSERDEAYQYFNAIQHDLLLLYCPYLTVESSYGILSDMEPVSQRSNRNPHTAYRPQSIVLQGGERQQTLNTELYNIGYDGQQQLVDYRGEWQSRIVVVDNQGAGGIIILTPEYPVGSLFEHSTNSMESFRNIQVIVNYPNEMLPEHFFRLFATSNVEECQLNIPKNLSTACYKQCFYDCPKFYATDFDFQGVYLPDSELVDECYAEMFYNCPSVTKIKVEFTQWHENATDNWVYGVASIGTFYKPYKLPTEYGPSRIPEGWAVVIIEDYILNYDTIIIPTQSDSTLPSTPIFEYYKPDILEVSILTDLDIYVDENYCIQGNYTDTVPTTLELSIYNTKTQEIVSKKVIVTPARSAQALTFYSHEGGTICLEYHTIDSETFKNSAQIYYAVCQDPATLDEDSYTEYETGYNIEVSAGEYVSLYNATDHLSYDTENYYQFTTTGRFSLTGDIQALLNYRPYPYNYCFYRLFAETACTVSPELSSNVLALGCYEELFHDCSSLATISFNASAWSAYDIPYKPEETLYVYETTDLSGTTNWVSGVTTPRGSFNKHQETLPHWYGNNYIPKSWGSGGPIKPLAFAPLTTTIQVALHGPTNNYQLQYCLKKNDTLLPSEKDTWTAYAVNTSIEVETDYIVYFRNLSSSLSTQGNIDPEQSSWEPNYFHFECVGGAASVSGVVDSLVNYSLYLADYTFYGLFYNCTNLNFNVQLLSTASVGKYAYAYMFAKSSIQRLQTSFNIGAWDEGACYSMFMDCTSLELACIFSHPPVVPKYGLAQMYLNCTGLASTGTLETSNHFWDITEISEYGCYRMFENCTYQYTTSVGTTKFTNNIKALPSIIQTHGCERMFYGDYTIIAAPELLAEAPGENAYKEMFTYCSGLKKIKVLFQTWGQFTDSWVDGVASTGEFYGGEGLEDIRGINNIPEKWTFTMRGLTFELPTTMKVHTAEILSVNYSLQSSEDDDNITIEIDSPTLGDGHVQCTLTTLTLSHIPVGTHALTLHFHSETLAKSYDHTIEVTATNQPQVGDQGLYWEAHHNNGSTETAGYFFNLTRVQMYTKQ